MAGSGAVEGEMEYDAWAAALPATVAACAAAWELRVGPAFQPRTDNFAAPVRRADGTGAVLKVCRPGYEFAAQVAALRAFDGAGAVRLLAVDGTRRAMLLERLEPGAPLSAVADDTIATEAAAGVMRQLWRPAPEGVPFPTVADWARAFGRLRARFDGSTGPLPRDPVELAEGLFAERLASMGEPVLLHGDLHHTNILAAGRAPWLAIDPKGVVGEAAYEPGALLRNPMPAILEVPDPVRVLARRRDQLAERFGFDRERLGGWAVAQAVLAGLWSLEDDGTGWEPWFTVAAWLHAGL